MTLLGDVVRSRKDPLKSCFPLRSLTLDAMIFMCLTPLLSSVSYEALEELKTDGCIFWEEGEDQEWQWAADISAPQLRTVTGSHEILPLLDALSYPGVAPRLRTIHLRGYGQPYQQVLATAISRGGWPDLKELDIFNLRMSGGAMKELMGAIEVGAPDLRALALAHVASDQGGGDCYLEVFHHLLHGACPRLECLTVEGDDSFGDDELMELARALEGGAPCSTTLGKLYVRSSGIGPRGVRELAAAFTRGACPNLKLLSLAGVPMKDEGVTELAIAIQAGAMPKLIVLDLGYAELGALGRTALFNALGDSEICPKLALLRLYHKNQISVEDRKAYVGQLTARRGRRKKVHVGWEWGKPSL